MKLFTYIFVLFSTHFAPLALAVAFAGPAWVTPYRECLARLNDLKTSPERFENEWELPPWNDAVAILGKNGSQSGAWILSANETYFVRIPELEKNSERLDVVIARVLKTPGRPDTELKVSTLAARPYLRIVRPSRGAAETNDPILPQALTVKSQSPRGLQEELRKKLLLLVQAIDPASKRFDERSASFLEACRAHLAVGSEGKLLSEVSSKIDQLRAAGHGPAEPRKPLPTGTEI